MCIFNDSPDLFNIHPSFTSHMETLSWADIQTEAEVRGAVWKKQFIFNEWTQLKQLQTSFNNT